MKTRTKQIVDEFLPVWWAPGKHTQTLLGHYTNRNSEPVFSKEHIIELDDGDCLSVIENRPNTESIGAAALILHGLGGDGDSRSIISIANRFVEQGWVVFRLSFRGVGKGAGMSRRLYHCGLSSDIGQALSGLSARHPELSFVGVGYSMGANTLLKYLGESGIEARRFLRGAIAVNPPVDTPKTIKNLEKKTNLIYHRRFAKMLTSQAADNGTYEATPYYGTKFPFRTIREFDNTVTVPEWGFASPDDYYAKISAVSHIEGIKVPTLILVSDDDPIVPIEQFQQIKWPKCVKFHVTEGGGHLGFLSKQKTPFGDRRWLDYAVITWSKHFAEKTELTTESQLDVE